MRRTPVPALRPGDVVGATVYTDSGQVLLASGVALTPVLIDALTRRGHYAVYVCDGTADDIAPEDLVSDRVRSTTVKHIREVFSVAAAAIAPGGKVPTAAKVQARQSVEKLMRDIDVIMNDVLHSQSLTGLTALKSHDDYTFSHCVDVAVTSIILGRKLFLPADEMRQLALGGLLHDIGKIFVPNEILNKPGPLTPDEFDVLKRHTTEGYQFLMEAGLQDFLAGGIVHQHHERQDGAGYPRGLKGSNRLLRSTDERWDRGRIQPLAEIAAVADVYSAISSDRPYRAAMTPTQIASTIKSMKGHHLNLEVVECFLTTIPVFPVGARAVIEGGKLAGFSGVVVENRSGQLDRPIVRLTHDRNGWPISPDEFDPATDSDARIVSPPPEKPVSRVA